MNLIEIQHRYDAYYEKAQYESKNGIASKVFHRALEYKLDKEYFENVLEVGAGAGQHLMFVKHGFKNYFLTDINQPKVSVQVKNRILELNNAQRKVQIESQNVEKMSYKDSSFDRIVSTCLFHHVENPTKGLSELRRVTQDGGLITIYLPSDPGLLYRLFQVIVSTSTLRKFFSTEEIKLLRASEHRNHISSLSGLIIGIFNEDLIRVRSLPKFNLGWNTRLFQIYSIKVRKPKT